VNVSFEYLDENIDSIKKECNIILSPKFYWVKKEELSLSNSKAKQIAKSIFEGELPEGDYSYFVKDNIFIAYDKQKILNFLESKNIKKSQIKKIYFAQFELKDELDEVDDIVITYPNKNYSINLENFKPTKNSVSLNENSRYFYSILIVLGVFTVLNFSEMLIFNSKLNDLESKKEKIKKEYSLPQTSYQLKAMLSKYKNNFETQLKIRQKLKSIKTKVQKIEVKKSKVFVQNSEGKIYEQ
jgi:hypothetical protein